MEINNINEKIIAQLNLVLEELKQAKSNTYCSTNLTRANISKAEGIIQTIKVILK